jgi:hypothetical protein
VILLFNWFGYRLLISFLEERADIQLEARLDENKYDESQLISVKVPASHLSPYTLSKFYERVDGKIEINGVSYNYVKRKVFDDSLELMCIPNHTAMKLQAAKNDFFKLINDLQHRGSKKAGSDLSKNISADYITDTPLFAWAKPGITISKGPVQFTDTLSSYFSSPIENPPEKNYSAMNHV